jgi:coenzyme F420-0:L-glutamate ligase / coenzyme F420-1:gamma-L-glutamate ligase
MSIKEAIKQRRSIRKYQERKVPEEIVWEVLETADWAPSAHNAQPWRFIVLSEAHLKLELAEAMVDSWIKDMGKDGAIVEDAKCKASIERFSNAPVLIVACLTMEDMRKYDDARRQGCERDLAMQSLGAALQNLLLAAYADGLGACWFSAPSFCKSTVRKVLKIPETIEPQAIINRIS